ncbi:histidine phosphatase family protein [Devosia sp.]|uniref:histidine phosphatase family protein n=1 Tax=Devosia sp. TaxID=1871048 RepID=UPI003A8DE007
MSFVWPELYFIRHGQTDWNAEGRYQGSRDIPLNAIGQGQADHNGVLLAQLLERDGRTAGDFSWHVSPLGRTRETMQRVQAAFSAPPEAVPDKRLVEVSFGIYEGKLHDELTPGEMVVAGERDASFWDFRPPGGESYQDVAERILDFAGELKGPAVIVAHGGILRVMRRLIEDYPVEEAVNWFPPQDNVVHFIDGKSTFHPASGAAAD